MFKNRRIWSRFGSIAVLSILIMSMVACGGRRQAATDSTEETAVAFIGELASSATASGQVQTSREAALSTKTPARVTEIFVRNGDEVQAGDLLVQLDTADLTLNTEMARQNLLVKEASLADLLKAPAAADLLAAETAVASAQATLDDLLIGATPAEIAAAEANLRASEAQLWASSADLASVNASVSDSQIAAAEAALLAAQLQQKSAREANEKETNQATDNVLQSANQAVAAAQAKLDALRAGPDSGQLGAAQGSLASANARADSSQSSLDKLLAGATAVQIANTQSQLAQAQATFADLVDGPTEQEITIAEAEVEQARLSLADAENALAQATIVAPFDGVVTAVYVNAGEIASGVVVEIIDNNSLEVVLEVDEVDIGTLMPGQTAVITLETWPDVEIESEVLSIAPSAKNDPSSALVTYEAHLSLADSALPIRVGMTANADLITADKKDVLLVPNQAINADRSSGTYSVTVVNGETQERVPVSIGLRDNQYTEITAGLTVGDVVRISSNIPTINFGPPGQNDGDN